jgi:hypothetical protein
MRCGLALRRGGSRRRNSRRCWRRDQRRAGARKNARAARAIVAPPGSIPASRGRPNNAVVSRKVGGRLAVESPLRMEQRFRDETGTMAWPTPRWMGRSRPAIHSGLDAARPSWGSVSAAWPPERVNAAASFFPRSSSPSPSVLPVQGCLALRVRDTSGAAFAVGRLGRPTVVMAISGHERRSKDPV